jgi:hypothetical protein
LSDDEVVPFVGCLKPAILESNAAQTLMARRAAVPPTTTSRTALAIGHKVSETRDLLFRDVVTANVTSNGSFYGIDPVLSDVSVFA